MKNIPNAISLFNLFLGCLALVFVFDAQLGVAAWLVIACSVLDFLDGATARLLNAYTKTGKQLDSLADLLSFGLVPAAIMFHYLENSLYTINPDTGHFVLSSVAFLIAVFSALRLARFTADEDEKDYFTGLPTPANALLIASIPITLGLANEDGFMFGLLNQLIGNHWFNLGFILLLSFLLIAPIRMFSLKVKALNWKQNRIRIIYIIGCIILLITFGWAAMPFFLVFYIILSLLWPVILPQDWR